MEFNPQQELFLKYLLDPKGSTFGNFLQSALKAGYAQEYAESISYQMPNWLADALGKSRMVSKAEKNLEIALEGGLDDPERGKKEIQWKATDFTLSRLKKDVYSERQEVTGRDGKDLIPETLTQEDKDKLNALLGK